jgi:2C-methyl-D-erythritol 2,4-cyclodiphosphate synthase
MRGAIAHELVGHRRAVLTGKTQEDDLLEEVQASIRAARFAPKLTGTERIILIRDALERLHQVGLKIVNVKAQLWINEP